MPSRFVEQRPRPSPRSVAWPRRPARTARETGQSAARSPGGCRSDASDSHGMRRLDQLRRPALPDDLARRGARHHPVAGPPPQRPRAPAGSTPVARDSRAGGGGRSTRAPARTHPARRPPPQQQAGSQATAGRERAVNSDPGGGSNSSAPSLHPVSDQHRRNDRAVMGFGAAFYSAGSGFRSPSAGLTSGPPPGVPGLRGI